MPESSLSVRLRNFVLALGATCAFIYVFLPILTTACPILHRMSLYLEDNGIDPTRYYYTDVEQVKESENYLRMALDDN